MGMCGNIDVLICGAGAAGLTLAIDLARRGIDFRLVDQLPEPFHGSRGKGIQPRTQEIFEDLGVLDRVAARGGIYPMIRTYAADGSYADQAVMDAGAPAVPAEPYPLPLMVPQFLTEAVMRERLSELGHAPQFASALTALTVPASHHAGVVATLRTAEGDETVRARYLVGCDGGRSFVRTSLGIGFPGKTLGVRAMVADVVLEGLSREVWHQFKHGDATHLSICPLAGTDLFQLQGPLPFEGAIDFSPAALTDRIAGVTGRSDIVVRAVSWASAYRMHARLADHYRCGPVFLVGDAAHVHPPTGGQGLNTSVQDAYNLGWKLAAVLQGAPASLLDTYEAERRPIAEQMLGLSTRLLEGFKTGDNRRGREVQQLDLRYPDSVLSQQARHCTAKVKPGDRAPDAPCRGRAGQAVRLFSLFQGPHWVLLGHQTTARPAPRAGMRIVTVGDQGEIADDAGHVGDAYGLVPEQWVLIRPDGYVAAIIASAELEDRLRDYLPGVMHHSGAAAGD
jgi:2-polyprenyl-6-methoxyphenol hydroxylase-like FAD-dependent oxidoreductase